MSCEGCQLVSYFLLDNLSIRNLLFLVEALWLISPVTSITSR
jgi:hypothetical protein